MLESEIVDSIKQHVLDPLGADIWYMKVHGSPFQKRSVPDILFCLRGHFGFMEAKRPGEDPTPGQRAVMKALALAGAIGGVVRSVEDAQKILDKIPV